MNSSLFKTDKYFLLVYETKEAAHKLGIHGDIASPARGDGAVVPRARSAYWSEKLDSHVWYSELGDVFLLLEEDTQENLRKVLHGERVGWIFNFEWLGLEEVR